MIKQIESLFNEIPRQPRDAFIVQTSLGGEREEEGVKKRRKKEKGINDQSREGKLGGLDRQVYRISVF